MRVKSIPDYTKVIIISHGSPECEKYKDFQSGILGLLFLCYEVVFVGKMVVVSVLGFVGFEEGGERRGGVKYRLYIGMRSRIKYGMTSL